MSADQFTELVGCLRDIHFTLCGMMIIISIHALITSLKQ